MQEELGLEKARIMFKLARKGNWDNSYDRSEHFKRLENLKKAVKELSESCWVIVHKKSKFAGISLNTKFKKEIIEFIENKMPYVKGMIR